MAVEESVFLVDPDSHPVAIKIVGRASFQNVMPLKDFLKDSAESGKRCYVFDFAECKGMDSTVLGVLAGCARPALSSSAPSTLFFKSFSAFVLL